MYKAIRVANICDPPTEYYLIEYNGELVGAVVVKDNACTMSCMSADLNEYIAFDIAMVKAVIQSW